MQRLQTIYVHKPEITVVPRKLDCFGDRGLESVRQEQALDDLEEIVNLLGIKQARIILSEWSSTRLTDPIHYLTTTYHLIDVDALVRSYPPIDRITESQQKNSGLLQISLGRHVSLSDASFLAESNLAYAKAQQKTYAFSIRVAEKLKDLKLDAKINNRTIKGMKRLLKELEIRISALKDACK